MDILRKYKKYKNIFRQYPKTPLTYGLDVDNIYINYLQHTSNALYETLCTETLCTETWNNVCEKYDNFINNLETYNNETFVFYKELYEYIKTVDPEKFAEYVKKIKGVYAVEMRGPIFYVFIEPEYYSFSLLRAEDDIEKELFKLSHAFCYYDSLRSIDPDKNGKEYLCIAYHVINTENVSDIVYNTYNGILWHVCPKSIYNNKVKKTGLLPKCNNKHKYKYVPRVYFFLTPDVIAGQNLMQYTKSLKDSDVYTPIDEPYVLLKIDLKKANTNQITHKPYVFYDDIEYGPNIAVYTYETIHPRCIEYIKEIIL